jgi:hypothetical protein
MHVPSKRFITDCYVDTIAKAISLSAVLKTAADADMYWVLMTRKSYDGVLNRKRFGIRINQTLGIRKPHSTPYEGRSCISMHSVSDEAFPVHRNIMQ